MALFDQEKRVVVDEMAEVMPASFWDDNRQAELKKKEGMVSQLLEKLRSNPVYYWLEKIIKILITGYVETNEDKDLSKFDFGPMNTTISGNTVEGAVCGWVVSRRPTSTSTGSGKVTLPTVSETTG